MGLSDLGPTRVFYNGDPMQDEDDQFATVEEALLQRHQSPVRWYPTPAPAVATKQEEPVREKKRPQPGPIMRIQNPPSGWVGNFKKEHDPGAELCMCKQCYLKDYPHLVVGDPVQVSSQYPITTPQMQAMVGLYDPKRIEHEVRCEVCGEIIVVNGELTPGMAAVHKGCLIKASGEHSE